MLSEQVEAGDLPPVEERLPETPLIVELVDRVGVYGGTWNTALLGPADSVWLERTIGYDPVLRHNREWSDRITNVAEVAASPDAREFTIALRPGMKWSDGAPFGADDLVFAYEDVLLNSDLTPVTPLFLVRGDEPGELEKVDDHTVRFSFAETNGLFIQQLAVPGDGDRLIRYPRHYLEQFHPSYNPDAEDAAASEDYADWIELYGAKADIWANSEIPTRYAWAVQTPLGEGNQVVAVRNPYYWKTDPDGRQLPYIDEVVYDVVSDEEVILLKATNGELDFHTRHINSMPNKPVLAQGRENRRVPLHRPVADVRQRYGDLAQPQP